VFGTQNLELGAWSLEFGIWNLELGILICGVVEMPEGQRGSCM
tara:strand:- start:1281 stop:1409 length:129 start_codon:yes stop_codon:yes gene_type:complete